jgi:hypothetical protein
MKKAFAKDAKQVLDVREHTFDDKNRFFEGGGFQHAL